ncbi:MAG: efflux transporter periplasmic adaptor subunit [Desulfuromonas sp.]|nr:MAG: efflux transporter periplasmic adaptor subunit [Desulfuromonas sp.]
MNHASMNLQRAAGTRLSSSIPSRFNAFNQDLNNRWSLETMTRIPGTIAIQSNQKSSGSRLKVGAIRSACLLLFALLTLFALSVQATAAPTQPEGPAPLVTVVAVDEQDVNPPREYVGHVEAIQKVELQARVEGVLEQVNFKEGSKVRAGDTLYVIEPAPYQAKVLAAKARVSKARAVLTRANNYLNRLQTVRPGGVSATDIEAAEAAQLEASADLQAEQAALTLAELDLGYTRILAPLNGRIGATALTAGNLCGPNSGTLATIVQIDPIRVQYSVSENDLAAIRLALADSASGQTQDLLRSQLRLSADETLDLVGQVDFVDNVVDAGTGTITVRLVFDNPDGRLLPGQYVTVLVSLKQGERMPVIPQSAVLEDRDGRYVLVVDAQKQVEQRRISTGSIVGPRWTVTSGLTAGEMVIVQGVQKVRPGQTVQTVIADQAKGSDQ